MTNDFLKKSKIKGLESCHSLARDDCGLVNPETGARSGAD